VNAGPLKQPECGIPSLPWLAAFLAWNGRSVVQCVRSRIDRTSRLQQKTVENAVLILVREIGPLLDFENVANLCFSLLHLAPRIFPGFM
jgi:hypothetical protein